MGRPIIGILSSRSDFPIPGGYPLSVEYASIAYCRAVVRGGGTPVLLPVTPEPDLAEQMFALCDGLLFPGGYDVDPRFYGEAPDPLIGILDSTTDRFWFQALTFALEHKLPLLGICRGMQLINVGLGGSLYQDLARREVPSCLHAQKQNRDYLMHQVQIEPDSRLAAVLGGEPVYTNTMHHQCVKQVGQGLKQTAQTDDGVPKALLIIPVYVCATGVLGAMGSMISTVVLFVPLGLSIAKQLRADRAFAVGLVICGSFTAFMSSPINMLTCIMGQTIAGIPEYSGGGLRTVVTVVNLIIVSAFLMLWVKRCQKDPAIYEKNFSGAEIGDGMDNVQEYSPLTGREIVILILFFGTFIFFAVGGVALGLSMLQLASIVLPVVLLIGFLGGYNLDETMKHWAKGTGGMAGVMLFMIFACYMNVILNSSGILDTLVYYISLPLSYLSGSLAVVGMFIANAIINVFINSGSGQTAIMMPIMAPLADVLGVTRQMSVLALQYGDGFTNLLAPTSVNLMACLAAAKIGLKDWYKLCVPLYAILAVVLIISIFVGTAIGYC